MLTKTNDKVNPVNTPNSDFAGVPNEEWEMVDAAKFYAERGWPVFPVSPSDKTPLIKAWQDKASTDHKQIEAWWRESPNAMIGILTGPRSGVAVVDVDNKVGPNGTSGTNGLDELAALENKYGDLGKVPTAYTPGGGWHLYFSWNSLPFAKNEGRTAERIDLRSARSDGSGAGFIIAPPSVNAEGHKYEWGTNPTDGPGELEHFPEAPIWLAVRACFKREERETIKDEDGLLALIESSPREEWQSAYKVYTDCSVAAEPSKRNSGDYGVIPFSHRYITKAVEDECRKVETSESAQNTQLFQSAAAIGNILAGAGLATPNDMDRDHVSLRSVQESLFKAAMKMRVLDRSRPWVSPEGQRAAKNTIRSGLLTGLANPRDLSKVAQKQSQEPGSAARGKLVMIPMSGISGRPVDWLWQERIPLGAVTLIAGDPSIGKSHITLDMAARVTRGKAFPEAGVRPLGQWTPQTPIKGSVILISCEDSPETTIAPRLEAAGADKSKVQLIKGRDATLDDGTKVIDPLSLQNSIRDLDAAITELGDVKLIIIDPISAYMGKTDSHKNTEVRSILAPLASLAEEHNCAIVAVSHLNKDDGKSGGKNALYRVTGSLGFTALPRSVFLVCPDPSTPGDTGNLLFLPAKANLSRITTGLELRLEDALLEGLDASKVVWGNTTALSTKEAMGGQNDTQSAVDDAKEFLEQRLSDGPVKAEELKKAAKSEEISWATIRRAQKALGATSKKRGFRENAYWEWALPELSTMDAASEG